MTIKSSIRKILLQPKIPGHLKIRQKSISQADKDRLEESLRMNFFSREKESYLNSSLGMEDLNAHLNDRLQNDRRYIIPWLDSVMSLNGKNILEIGCGTGASTVALAEQGANVIGIDVDDLAMKSAELRCQLYGLDVKLERCNAAEFSKSVMNKKFDMIIFYAVLEHMTHTERIASLLNTWNLLDSGGVMGIIETPNRLWHFDSHTAHLPFFHWLPDDIAMKYSTRSSRELFNKGFSGQTDANYIEFMRWGRGASYHELEIAIDNIDLKSSVSCNYNFIRKQRLASWLKWRISKSYRYQAILSAQKPDIDHAFFQPYLNFTVKK